MKYCHRTYSCLVAGAVVVYCVPFLQGAVAEPLISLRFKTPATVMVRPVTCKLKKTSKLTTTYCNVNLYYLHLQGLIKVMKTVEKSINIHIQETFFIFYF